MDDQIKFVHREDVIIDPNSWPTESQYKSSMLKHYFNRYRYSFRDTLCHTNHLWSAFDESGLTDAEKDIAKQAGAAMKAYEELLYKYRPKTNEHD